MRKNEMKKELENVCEAYLKESEKGNKSLFKKEEYLEYIYGALYLAYKIKLITFNEWDYLMQAYGILVLN